MEEPYVIDLSGWTRLPEAVHYADVRGIDFGDAIRELVNAGLSNWNGNP
ncbi:Uncharacterised protein [Mycobacteroides abscessus subsp. massiliense]|nr:hypothetical protein [Mycobacteroides abscessus]SKM80560.1 Uncharacterised protein [Mycobacteroides abscessus subsp. massiliense]SKM96837.1 Uncharacterised protein [Mycobacteroides abscessus subsp. massiliense]SKN75868.1 Uncharacterised protein [Mycobacteroides abscessus subsp. massiliense]SKN97377.1 Uncharacterised protein [Mycobacteroides abscessus subsp. massiliense]SKO20484.1 Uncharacterised protein [Mycobacteroides abscessus subsp. massiliense]